MGKHDVDIFINAKGNASREFGLLGNSFANLGGIIKKTVAGIGIYLGTREIIRGVQGALAAYGEQEEALATLQQALKLLGYGTNEEIKDLASYAEQLQKTTKYSDELILNTMKLGVTMGGIYGPTLKDATKAAIGLSVALDIDLETAMRAIAKSGEGLETGLARLGINIKGCKTNQEAFNLVMQKGLQNFPIAEVQARTYNGTLARMKNSFSEIKEVIGKAMMPVFQPMFENINMWLQDNKNRISTWASVTVEYVGLIKDVFVDFADYMKSDWKGGLKFVFDAFIETLKAMADTSVVIAIQAGKGIWAGLKEGLMGGTVKELEINRRMEELYTKYRQGGGKEYIMQDVDAAKYGEFGYVLELTELGKKIRKQAEKEITDETVHNLIGGTLDTLGEIWKETLDTIESKAPPELAESVRKSLEEHRVRLQKIITGELKQIEGLPAYEPFNVPGIIGTAKKEKSYHGWAPYEASHMVGYTSPRIEANYEAQTARYAKTATELLRQSVQVQRQILKETRSGERVSGTDIN